MKLEILVNDVEGTIADWHAAIEFAGQKLLEKGYITPEYIQACPSVKRLIQRVY